MLKEYLKSIILVSAGIIVGTGLIYAASADTAYTYYLDEDGDGYGSEVATTTASNEAPDGYVTLTGDCDDSLDYVNPGETEVCDYVDNDCDLVIDENVKTTYYYDADSDTYGNLASSTELCAAPSNYVENSSDCDDTDDSIHPNATEEYDGVDNNCDGEIDEGFEPVTFYRDSDGDTYGDADVSTTSIETSVDGYVLNSYDCDDTDSAIHPGATEVADDVDNDCDGLIDESKYYRDLDEDGYGNPSIYKVATTAPEGYVSNDDDCNDDYADMNPGEEEVYDGRDNDCDGYTDEGFTLTTYYRDADEDGYGNPSRTATTYTQPEGYVTNDDDCDDSDSSIHPGATEVDDDVDNNCDGSVDEDFDKETYYRDADGDGYGDADNTVEAYTKPAGYVTNDDDCDDTDSAIHPGASELDDDKDNDCDGKIDEGFSTIYSSEIPGEPEDYSNHGAYISSWSHYLNYLKDEGEISGRDKGQMMKELNQNKNQNKNQEKNQNKNQNNKGNGKSK